MATATPTVKANGVISRGSASATPMPTAVETRPPLASATTADLGTTPEATVGVQDGLYLILFMGGGRQVRCMRHASHDKGAHRRKKVDEKSCVTFLLCDPGWYVQRT